MSTETPKPSDAPEPDGSPPTVKLTPLPQDDTQPPTEPAGTAPLPNIPIGEIEIPILPGYEIQAVLGRGSMGIVFKAIQTKLKRPVAVKMMLPGHSAGSAEVVRFRIEAEAAAKLDHVAIVPIYEVGEHEGQHFFSMKLVEGGTLASRLSEFIVAPDSDEAVAAERQKKLSLMLAKIADAVQCAHDHGILHRDLKPGNILLDAKSEPHVADFGLAKRVEGESVLTQTGIIVGTPSYMAPEQAGGQKKLTHAADIYSLGAILYELLTGRPPFKGETVMDTLRQVLDTDPVSPRSINPTVSRDLETICLKAMAKDPEGRFASARVLADELRRFAAGEPIQTRPPGWIEHAWRACRRNPLVAGLSAALVIAGLIVAGFLIAWLQPARTDGSFDRVKAAGKLVIVIDDNYPPMEFRDKEGKLVGFDHDLAKAIAKQLNVDADIRILHWDWPDVPAGLNRGDCDMVISAWTITSERKQQAAFVEYLRLGQVFACKRGISVVNEKDLAGKRVIVGADTVAHTYLRNLKAKGIDIKEIVLLKAGEEPFPGLKADRADVTIVDEPVGRYHARIDADIVVTGSIGHAMNPDPVGMVFRQKDVQLQEAVAKALRELNDNGEFARILEKWFGK